jgi:anti-sigma-K factor RskA
MTQQIEIHTLAGAYALDALTEFERAAFDRHIADCTACATEVAELRETAARLAAPAWEAPPPAMRANVLAQISRTRQVGPAVTREPRRSDDVRRWRRLTAAAAAAAVVAAGAGGTTWYISAERVRDAEQVALRQQQIDSVLTAPDVRVRTQDFSGGGRVSVFVSDSRDQGVAVVSNFDTPPTDKVYQLWVMTGANAVPSTVMDPGQTAGTSLITGVRGADTLGITREPESGSRTPSEQPPFTVPLR